MTVSLGSEVMRLLKTTLSLKTLGFASWAGVCFTRGRAVVCQQDKLHMQMWKKNPTFKSFQPQNHEENISNITSSKALT